jgi:SAM-dependent methyltransferase
MILTTGNTAKLYCLNWLEQLIQSRTEPLSILDLGCGQAKNFTALLHRYPQTTYVGIDPSPSECATARRELAGLKAEIMQGYGYNVYARLGRRFDVVISFSVLEHVYRRVDYLKSAKDCLAPDGHFLINYDSGHFVAGGVRDRAKNLIGPIMARLGQERYYQSLVREADFQAMLKQVGLRIVEEKVFNTRLKGLYKLIPPAQREAYMHRWLDFELFVNTLGLPYEDKHAGTFFTRNFILSHA